jgi:hypothetical protein
MCLVLGEDPLLSNPPLHFPNAELVQTLREMLKHPTTRDIVVEHIHQCLPLGISFLYQHLKELDPNSSLYFLLNKPLNPLA